MDKNVAGLLAVASVLAVPAHAATALPVDVASALRASSYADLLAPIPNAAAILKASAEATSAAPETTAEGQSPLMEARYWYHHHHHHHHWRRRWHHHHHHTW